MARLALFRGGFTLEAAETAAETSPYVLAGLVENALIRLDEFERYQIHELLRQFAYAQLVASPEYDGAAAAHAKYFFTPVISRKDALDDSRQQAALAAIQAEMDNVRTAWQWAIQQPGMPYIAAATDPLYDFFRYTCRYSEGKELFAAGAARLRDRSTNSQSRTALEVAEHLETLAAVFCYHLGEHAEAAQCFQAVLAAARDGRAAGRCCHCPYLPGIYCGLAGPFPRGGAPSAGKCCPLRTGRRSQQPGGCAVRYVGHVRTLGVVSEGGRLRAALPHPRDATGAQRSARQRALRAGICPEVPRSSQACLGTLPAGLQLQREIWRSTGVFHERGWRWHRVVPARTRSSGPKALR